MPNVAQVVARRLAVNLVFGHGEEVEESESDGHA